MNENLKSFIALKLGQVSMCWSETPKGRFESEKVDKILDDIMDKIEHEHLKDVEERRTRSQLL